MKIIFYIVLFFIPLFGYTDSKCNESFLPKKNQYRDYQSAAEYVQQMNITSVRHFKRLKKEKKIPEDIPSNPNRTYKNQGWISWGHFFGTGRVATKDKKFRIFKKAMKYIQKKRIKSAQEYH